MKNWDLTIHLTNLTIKHGDSPEASNTTQQQVPGFQRCGFVPVLGPAKKMTHHSKTQRSKPNSHSCRESNLATKLLYANMIGVGISVIKNNFSLQPLLNSLETAMDERGERFDG